MSGGARFRPSRGPERLAGIAQSRCRLGRHDCVRPTRRAPVGARAAPRQPDLPNAATGSSPRRRRRVHGRPRVIVRDVRVSSALPTAIGGARPEPQRLRSMPLSPRQLTRRDQRLDLTSSGREPSTPARRRCGRGSPRRRSGRSRRAPRQPAVAHLEHADVVRRAEAVLQRAQRPVGARVALELQDAVTRCQDARAASEPSSTTWPRRCRSLGETSACDLDAPGRRPGPRQVAAPSVCTESMTRGPPRRSWPRRSRSVSAHRHVERPGAEPCSGARRQADLRRDSSPET